MTTNPEKPSRNEDEFFARQDAELIERQKKHTHDAATQAERKSHSMRCPKCGGYLVTADFQGTRIDQCPDCRGVWLDNGELDALASSPEPGLLGRVLGDVLRSLGKKPTS